MNFESQIQVKSHFQNRCLLAEKVQRKNVVSRPLMVSISDTNEHFFLKKQIMKPSINWIGEGAIPIVFPYESLPVTITWDKSLFNNIDRDYSIITDWLPGGWFDAGNGTLLNYLNDTSKIEVPSITSPDELSRLKEFGYTYLNNDTQYPLRTIYVAFASKDITGVNSIKSDSYIQISPNPVINNLNIKYQNKQSVQSVKIYSIEGKILKSLKGFVPDIDCSELKNGMYFLSVESNGKIDNVKFIKQ